MRGLPSILALTLALVAPPLDAREAVEASAPKALSVTVYRDPERGAGEAMEREMPRGFAMISETRSVTLPPGESTIRFIGVAEGMVAVSAIVTGLPGGTIEKNRNADLLSPAALVDGTLGNRVRITRTNPATGVQTSESAVVRTRADGGLVLQTAGGFEAVGCAGLPEGLSFDRIPAGLAAGPVYSVDTRSLAGGTYQVTLTYLAWGFDWQANYVATLKDSGVQGKVGLSLLSWLTVLNDNGQSFADATLLAVAGRINVESDFESLAEPPQGRPLQLTCYPLGSTADGTPPPFYGPYPSPPPPPAPMMAMADSIIVTGSRRDAMLEMSSPVAVVAAEEQLGDLKLYRIPEPMTVAAKGVKQVAFLQKDEVRGEFFYSAFCDPYGRFEVSDNGANLQPAQQMLFMKNDRASGLGAALPMGSMALFEPGPAGTQLVGELDLRDYALDQDIELELGQSSMVFAQCARMTEEDPDADVTRWTPMRAEISNANATPVRVRLALGYPGDWEIRWPRGKPVLKDGAIVVELRIPANSSRTFDWKLRSSEAE